MSRNLGTLKTQSGKHFGGVLCLCQAQCLRVSWFRVSQVQMPFATSFLFLVVMPLLVAMPWLLASPFWGVQPPGTGSWTAQRAAQRGWAPTCSSVRPWVDASGGPGIETRDPAIPSRFCRRQLVYVSIVFACQGMTGSMNSYSHDFPFIVHDSFTTHFTRIISD